MTELKMNSVIIYRVLAVAMLAGIGAHHYATVRRPAGIDAYHRRVREAAARIPTQIAGWIGEDTRVSLRATSVLRPNVMISRKYVNVETGLTANLLFVHCADSHHMAGHYPLRCYPANGWTLKGQKSRDWAAGDLTITGVEYEFTMDVVGRTDSVVVANCLMLPGGRIVRDMNGMARAIAGVGGQQSGAAQLQIYFNSDVPPDQRDAAIVSLIKGYRPLIDAVLANAIE